VPNTLQQVGSYEDYNIAFLPDDVIEREYLENLHYAIFPTDEIALAYKFAWVQRETISVKLSDNYDTVDWQLDIICQSLEERIDTEETKTGEYYLARSDGDLGIPISQPTVVHKIKYTLTDTDKSNGMEFLKIYNKLVLDRVYNKRLKEEQLYISEIESLSWDQQRKEAEAYNADNTASTPLLTKLAEARDITIAQMVSKVGTAIENYYEKLAVLLAKKQKIEAELRACATLLELHVVNAHHFGFYLSEDRIIEAGYDPATFVNATVDL
jgi:hypothetical protein